MKTVACLLAWLGLGALGAAGLNARYQFDPNWQEGGCYTQERRHLTDELFFFSTAPFGPASFMLAAIQTGLFDTGFSFRFGTPARCGWAHNYNEYIKHDTKNLGAASSLTLH